MHQSDQQTDYKHHLRKRILRTASREFFSHGIRSVKMDDIAGKLKISKRTLYEIFDNKESLLLSMVKEEMTDFDDQMQKVTKQEGCSVITVLLEFYRMQMERLNQVCIAYYEDLQKFPIVLKYLEDVRVQHENDGAVFFKKGVDEGYFLGGLDYALISRLASETMENAMESKMYKEYSLKKIFHNVILLFIRGMCTQKGIEELDRQIFGPKSIEKSLA